MYMCNFCIEINHNDVSLSFLSSSAHITHFSKIARTVLNLLPQLVKYLLCITLQGNFSYWYNVQMEQLGILIK